MEEVKMSERYFGGNEKLKRIEYDIYSICHKYGKLVSCNPTEPAPADKMFCDELLKLFENGKS